MAAGVGAIFEINGIFAMREVINGNEVQNSTIMVNGNNNTIDKKVVNSCDKISVPEEDGTFILRDLYAHRP